MKSATIFSVCECQARLGAELDEHKYVKEGWAIDRRRHLREKAPAHSIHAERAVFQVAWFCPFCIRNTLRSFDTSGLAFREHAESDAPPAGTPASGG